MLDNALDLKDLLAPPGNRLERLRGIEPDSTAFGSTIGGESVLSERRTDLMKLKSLIVTEGERIMSKNGMRPVYPGARYMRLIGTLDRTGCKKFK